MDQILETLGEATDDYPYAYLVTAPRFLGHSFNPVSFWYLYDKQKELKAMILEVNNTFDERRLYFLKSTLAIGVEGEYSPDLPSAIFKGAWPKDFHVSPFNSRKGSYALKSYDPFSPHLSGIGMIDNTITLKSSKCHPKLVARVFSTGASSDPAALGYVAGLRFVLAWWWVGFVTFPRIVKEAGKLFFRRKLHVWYRPEVLKDSIGRRPTNDEIIIESTFRSFLKDLMAHYKIDLPLNYISSIPSSLTSEDLNPQMKEALDSSKEAIDFKVTTPLFFSRLARHSHISECLSNEILSNDDKDRTFYTSHPQLLLQLFEQPTTFINRLGENSSVSTGLRWRFLKWLRNHRIQTTKGDGESQHHFKSDIRYLSFSQLDAFCLKHESPIRKAQYVRVVTKILVSDIIAFGHPEILDAVNYLLMMLASYLFVNALRDFWRAAIGEDWVIVPWVCDEVGNEACAFETM
ncbi:MAG: hypothetical protein Q9213_004860 [Squamulea squamosa]